MSSPRQILYLTPSVRMLGARRSLHQLVRGLDPERYVPHVVVPEEGGLTEALDAAGVGWTVLRLRPWRKGRSWPFIPSTLRRLRAIVRERDAALIHCNEIYPCPYAVRSSQGRPVVCHVRLERTPAFVRKYHAGRADAIVGVSRAVIDPMRSPEACVDAAKLHAIYNGLEIEAFQNSAEAPVADKGVAEALSTVQRAIDAMTVEGQQPLVIGQFGLLSKRKRHNDVLAALASINEKAGPEDRKILYVVLGDIGPRGPENGWRHPREIAKERGLILDLESGNLQGVKNSAAAIFLPFQPVIAPFYPLVDAVILPSDQEGFGRVLIEAAAMGKPALGSRVGGIVEVIDDGETGLVFEVGDTEAIRGAFEKLAGDQSLRERLGEAAREKALRNFSLQAHVASVQALYDRLLKQ